jgi:hypothetical protein
VTREAAARVAALLQVRYPHGDVTVTRIPDGLHVEVHHEGGSSLFAVIDSEHSPVLTVISAVPDPAS